MFVFLRNNEWFNSAACYVAPVPSMFFNFAETVRNAAPTRWLDHTIDHLMLRFIQENFTYQQTILNYFSEIKHKRYLAQTEHAT
jgi:hypothetical protein